MRKNLDVLLLYPTGEALSNPPQVVVQWPRGLSGPAEVFLLGNSQEESEEIRQLLEGLLQTAKEGAASLRQ